MARPVGSDGEKTAKQIRRHSVRLFARHGYAAVSMRQIAEKVGVQASALYQYYPNKQQLLVAVMCDHMRDLLAAWANTARASDSPPEALERFARFHIRFHIKKPDDVFVSYMELRALEPEGFRQIEKLRHDYEAALRAIIARGRQSGIFTVADAHVGAMAILAMLTGVNSWYRAGGRLTANEIEDIYAQMVLGSVGHTPKGG